MTNLHDARVTAAAKAMEKLPLNLVTRAEAVEAAMAALGAAPQAESAPKSSYISPSLPAMIRNLWKSDPSENSVRTALKLAGDLIQELIDLKAAPVLPSSGVDEERLAEYARVKQAEALEEFAEKWATADGMEALMLATNAEEAVMATERELLACAALIRGGEEQ